MCFSLNTSRYSKNVPCVVLLEGRVSFPEVLVVVKAGLGGEGEGEGCWVLSSGRERESCSSEATLHKSDFQWLQSSCSMYFSCVHMCVTLACVFCFCVRPAARAALLVSAALAVFCLRQSSLDLRVPSSPTMMSLSLSLSPA